VPILGIQTKFQTDIWPKFEKFDCKQPKTTSFPRPDVVVQLQHLLFCVNDYWCQEKQDFDLKSESNDGSLLPQPAGCCCTLLSGRSARSSIRSSTSRLPDDQRGESQYKSTGGPFLGFAGDLFMKAHECRTWSIPRVFKQ
jgi:hypothetical protein